MIEFQKFQTVPPEPTVTYAYKFEIPEGMNLARACVDVATATDGAARVYGVGAAQRMQVLFSPERLIWVDVNEGDYIVSVGGRYHVVAPHVFEAVYVPEGETAPPAPLEKPKRVRRTQAQIAADKAAKEASK